jgi:hypothetical protein
MRKIVTFTTATLLMASAFGAGEVYRWKGADGTWHYSDQPRPGAEMVSGSQANREPPAAQSNSDPSRVPANELSMNIPVSDAVAREVRAEAAAAKSKRCKDAEANYQTSITAGRIYRTDDKGNRVYLNAAETDAARLKARADRDQACGP